MKFTVLIGVAATMGALMTAFVPSAVLESGAKELDGIKTRLSGVGLADLNPLRAVYDWEMREVNTPRTPEELGLHPTSTVNLKPVELPTNDLGFGRSTRTGGVADVRDLQQDDPPH